MFRFSDYSCLCFEHDADHMASIDDCHPKYPWHGHGLFTEKIPLMSLIFLDSDVILDVFTELPNGSRFTKRLHTS